jgi:hypothetical protein
MWVWDGGFRANKRELDGSAIEKIFTSSALARQFVEKHEGIVLATKAKPRTKSRNKNTRRNSKPLVMLTPTQQALKDKAMKQMQGLKPVR